MEYCTLDNAFPAMGSAAAGCRQGEDPAAVQRREERRRAKKCKGPQQKFLDADRQAMGLDTEPTPMRGSGANTSKVNPFNPETGLYEHQPLTADSPLAVDDDLVNAPRSAYEARRPPSNTNASKVVLRETEGPTTLIDSASRQPPAYFGADPLDESFTNFNPIVNEKEYTLQPDFATTFGTRAEDKASGAILPIPSVIDAWKRLTPSGANTAFIEYLPPPGGNLMPPVDHMGLKLGGSGSSSSTPPNSYGSGTDMKRRFDEIFSRLDQLENQAYSSSENNQMEVFLFILSGMFVMFTVDMFARAR